MIRQLFPSTLSLFYSIIALQPTPNLPTTLQSVSGGVAEVADRRRLLGTCGTFANLCDGLVVVADNRRRSLVDVPDAAPAELALAGCIVSGRRPDVAGVLLDRGLDVAEDGALEQGVRGCTFDGVADVVGPEVVDHVDDGVAAQLWRAALGVVDVVVLEGYRILCAGHVDCPVVVAVAAGRPVRLALDEVVRDCDTSVLGIASYNVLAAD